MNMVQKVELSARQVVMDLLRRFGSLSFRHLLAITDLPVIELKHSLHDLIIHRKIQQNTEIAPEEGIIVFYEVISDDPPTNHLERITSTRSNTRYVHR